MANAADVRRALSRGDTDEALVLAWNALEPLRLRGDRSGLKAVGETAAFIAEHGDGSQAREAERLLTAVRSMLQPEAAADVVRIGAAERDVSVLSEAPDYDDGGADDVEYDVDHDETTAGDDDRPRLGKLVWALIVAAFVIFNIVSGLLRE